MTEKVLITGGAGFVGHALIEYLLLNTDYEIVSLDRLDTSGTLFRLSEVLENPAVDRRRVKIVWHDLKAEINPFVAAEIGPVEYVLHLAAGSHVDRSIDDPLSFVMDNVVGTCNLLNYARTYLKERLRLFIYFGTDEVFGPAPEGVFYKEDDRFHAGNPYAATKAGAEELAIAFQNTYRMPIIVTHTMNLFGVRQHPEKFIPLVMRKVLCGEVIQIHSNKQRTIAGKRHYLSTSDLSEALLLLLGKGRPGEKYNLVGEKELDNLTLAQLIAGFVGRPLLYEMVDFHSSRPGHDLRYALDGSKMACLGWKPRVPVEERLGEVVQWTLAHQRWIGMESTCTHLP